MNSMSKQMSLRLFGAVAVIAWASLPAYPQQQLPEAPSAQFVAQVVPPGPPTAQMPAGTSSSADSSGKLPSLTLAEAERMAQEHNPNISVAHLLALGQAQVTREVRSAELPMATGSLTAVGSHADSRVTAGELNNPSIYDRAAGGLTVTQLITDFGR